MKKLTTLMISAVVCGAMLTSCGGGGGGSSKSGLKKSDFFGNLPALYADNDLARAEAKERMGNVKSMKEAEKENARQEKAQAKRDAAIKTEEAKIVGKDVPFTFSSALQAAADYTISSIKVYSGGGFNVTIVPSKVETNLIGVSSFPVSFRFIAKDGSTIHVRENVKVFGQKDSSIEFALSGLSVDEKMIDFASIEFLTAEEARKLQ